MVARDIIVIGGSAGGIDALRSVVRSLPEDLPAAVCVVVHVPPFSVSRLPEILTRDASLPATHARDGEPVEIGRIYVAPPDQHLLVRDGAVALSRGPRENHSRPAIDPLFRSAARDYGSRVLGVILSGALYDGTIGLAAVKARGGIAIVQDPDEAAVPSMPRNALKQVEADFILPAARIGDELTRLVRQAIGKAGNETMVDDEEQILQMIERDFSSLARNEHKAVRTVYTCPDCGGVLWQSGREAGGGFRCHVGHSYAPEALIGPKSEEVEAALWACVRLLKEKATLIRQAAARSLAGGHGEIAGRIDEQALLDERRADVIRELLESSPNASERVIALLAGAGDETRENAESIR